MFFSVIIPLYNKAPYIEKSLKSIAAQTFQDYELIVVDDGSKDESAMIAENKMNELWEPKSRTQQVQLIRQKNAGVSTARNNGVARSCGDYICFLDADDWWEPTFLGEMEKLINEYPDAGIYGTNYTIVNETKHKTRIAPIGIEPGFEKGYINYCKIYAKTLCMPLTSISICIPRHVFLETNGFKPHIKLGEDFELWIRIALKYKVAFLNKPLGFYNQDVDVKNRGIGHLHKPKNHMLWNLDYMSDEEISNPDYKHLIDKLRVTGLFQYYISHQYHNAASSELAKVDWKQQPRKINKQYKRPLCILRMIYKTKVFASKCKTIIVSILYRLHLES